MPRRRTIPHAAERRYWHLSATVNGANVIRFQRPDDLVDEVTFGVTTPGNAPMVLCVAQWLKIGVGAHRLVLRVSVDDDSLSAYAEFADVFAELATWQGRIIAPHEFLTLLDAHGFLDKTKRVAP